MELVRGQPQAAVRRGVTVITAHAAVGGSRSSSSVAARRHVLVRIGVTLRRRLRPSQAAASESGMGAEQRSLLQLADLAGATLFRTAAP